MALLAAIAAAVAYAFSQKLAAFRIDAIYEILSLHAIGACFATALIAITRRTPRTPSWAAKATLAAMPVILGISCDRLALLSYPPAPPEPRAIRFQRHPTRMWALRPNTEAPLLDIKLNEHATRGPVVPFEKPPGETRVVILGDSVAFGFGVGEEHCFERLTAEHLREIDMPEVTIVNLSVPGYSPWQHLDLLQNEGIAYDPDVVVYAFCFNDVIGWYWRHIPLDRPRPFRYPILEASGLLRLGRGVSYDLWRRSVQRTLRPDLHTVELVLSDADTPAIHEAWSVMLEHVRQMVEFTRTQDRRMAFLMFPAAAQLAPEADRTVKPNRRLCAVAEANGIPYLDLFEPFREYCGVPGHSHTDLFIDGWHLSSQGHEVTAAASRTSCATRFSGDRFRHRSRSFSRTHNRREAPSSK